MLLTILGIVFLVVTIIVIGLIICKVLVIVEIFWAIITGMIAFICFAISHRLKLEDTLTEEEWEQRRKRESESVKTVREMKLIVGTISIVFALILLCFFQ